MDLRAGNLDDKVTIVQCGRNARSARRITVAKSDGVEAVLSAVAFTGAGILLLSLLSPAQARPQQRPTRTKLFDDRMPALQRHFLWALTNRRGDMAYVQPFQYAQARRDIEGYLAQTAARVHREVLYIPDVRTSGLTDFWQSPEETLHLGTGDCEDHAILAYRRLKEAGFTLVDLVVGLYGTVGHAWVEVAANGQRYVLEGTNGTVFRGRPSHYLPGVWMTMTGYRMDEFGVEMSPASQMGFYS